MVYDVGMQLNLPLYARPIPGPVTEVVAGLRDAPVEVRERDDFDRLHDELEGLYVGLQSRMAYGPAFKDAWDKARAATCESHGWTSEAFYAELSKRMKEKREGRR